MITGVQVVEQKYVCTLKWLLTCYNLSSSLVIYYIKKLSVGIYDVHMHLCISHILLVGVYLYPFYHEIVP